MILKKKNVVSIFLMLFLLASAICSGAEQPKVEIRTSWWGGVDRHAKFNEIYDLYERENPNIKIIREFSNWPDYWAKLPVQIAAGNPPDIPSMTVMALREYASKGVLEVLNKYVASKQINLTDWDETIVDTGRVGDTIYMISAGNTAVCYFVNEDLIKGVGMRLPNSDMTYGEFADYLKELQKLLPEGTYAVNDAGYEEHLVDTFIRQNGTEFITLDGKKLAFSKETLKEYLRYWVDLRHITPPPQVSAEEEAKVVMWEGSMLVKDKLALHLSNCNQLHIPQRRTESKLSLIRVPRLAEGVHPRAEILQPSAFTISSVSKHKDEAAKLINWFVNDFEAQLIFMEEWGVPGSKTIQKKLLPYLSRADKLVLQFMANLTKDTYRTIPRPEGAGAVFSLFQRKYDEIRWGKKSVDEAVDEFFVEASSMLTR